MFPFTPHLKNGIFLPLVWHYRLAGVVSDLQTCTEKKHDKESCKVYAYVSFSSRFLRAFHLNGCDDAQKVFLYRTYVCFVCFLKSSMLGSNLRVTAPAIHRIFELRAFTCCNFRQSECVAVAPL